MRQVPHNHRPGRDMGAGVGVLHLRATILSGQCAIIPLTRRGGRRAVRCLFGRLLRAGDGHSSAAKVVGTLLGAL